MMDNLAMNALLASQAGMSYGQWKALHPVTIETDNVPKNKPDMMELVCLNCGKKFLAMQNRKNRKYCNPACANSYNCKKHKERMKRKNGKTENVRDE
jgi:hypothetical protein